MFRSRFLLTGLAFVLLLFASDADSQTITKRVVFAKGRSSASFKHRLPTRYADYDAYLVRARKGQTLTIKLIADDPKASISIFETKVLGPGEDSIIGDAEFPRSWSGKLPLTSEYSIQVYGPRSIDDRARGNYTIEITIR